MIKALTLSAVVVLSIVYFSAAVYASHITDGFSYPVAPASDYSPNQNPFLAYNSDFRKYHLGEDWNFHRGGSSDLGHPVYAIANGHVTYAQQTGSKLWGYVIIVKHVMANGLEVCSLYGHVQDPDKPETEVKIKLK